MKMRNRAATMLIVGALIFFAPRVLTAQSPDKQGATVVHLSQLSDQLPKLTETLHFLEEERRTASDPEVYMVREVIFAPPELREGPASEQFMAIWLPVQHSQVNAQLTYGVHSGKISPEKGALCLEAIRKKSQAYQAEISKQIVDTQQEIESVRTEIRRVKQQLANLQPASSQAEVSPTVETSNEEIHMGALEPDTNRLWKDLNNALTENNAGGADACRSRCLHDTRCTSFTWVKRGVQGDEPRCWIKGGNPPGKTPDSCCISGVKLPIRASTK